MFPWFTMDYQIISIVVNDGSAWGMRMNDGRYWIDNYSQTYHLEIILSRFYGYSIGTNNEILLQLFCEIVLWSDDVCLIDKA